MSTMNVVLYRALSSPELMFDPFWIGHGFRKVWSAETSESSKNQFASISNRVPSAAYGSSRIAAQPSPVLGLMFKYQSRDGAESQFSLSFKVDLLNSHSLKQAMNRNKAIIKNSHFCESCGKILQQNNVHIKVKCAHKCIY